MLTQHAQVLLSSVLSNQKENEGKEKILITHSLEHNMGTHSQAWSSIALQIVTITPPSWVILNPELCGNVWRGRIY